MDGSDKQESKGGEPKPEKIRAEDNPWYLLSTLYGVLGADDHELIKKNQIAWNRYFAANLDEETNKAYRKETAP